MESVKSEYGNGGVELPIGFRFRPTDAELVIHYLRRKICSQPLPASVIPDLEVLQTNPWDLPGDLKEKKHFFCQRRQRNNFINKCNSSLSTDCGYWKSTGKNKEIIAPGRNLIMGIKKSFVFWFNGIKTQWVMHEFSLVASVNSPHLTQKLMVQIGNWVVCRVYQRNKKSRKVNQSGNKNKKFITQIPISSCSSGITEICSSDIDQEASSGNGNVSSELRD